MNERIENLVVQSKLIEIIDSSYLERDDWEPFVEKFAELIVRECIEIVENSQGDTDFAIWKLKKDFGVE